MRKLIACIALLSLAYTALSATVTASTVSATNFNVTPVLVYDSTVDTTTWATVNKDYVWWSAGTENTTIYAWGLVSTDGMTLTTLYRRSVNATAAAAGTQDTNGDDVTYTLSLTSSGVSAFAVGSVYWGVFITKTVTKEEIQFYSVPGNGTSLSSVTQVTDNSAGTATTFALGCAWYESGIFYIVFEAQDATPQTTGLYLQGVWAWNNTKLWTTEVTLASSLTVTATAHTAVLSSMGGGSNYSSSMYALILWKDGSKNIKATTVTLSSGSASSATLKTDSGTDPTLTYAPGGIIASNYTYGFTVGLTSVTSAPVTTYNITAFYNGSSTETDLSFTSVSGATSVATLMGWRYTTGFAVVANWQTTSPYYTYAYQTYLANGTVNTTQTTFLVAAGPVNGFVDANGAAWVGYTSYDTTGVTPLKGYVGTLFGQVNQSGNVLATFAAFVAMMIISLFMF